ncbi:MAG: hypothetical protein OEX04_18225 [Acidimicrobiia bacterium]|nr:hypothetical protein [Acidimicrobiia bacterium]MDH4309411.1 hypothetical protein [Acidimicrobiia bacterium]
MGFPSLSARVLFQIRNRRGLGHLMRTQNIALAMSRLAPDLRLAFHASTQPTEGFWPEHFPLVTDAEASWSDYLGDVAPDVVVFDTVLPAEVPPEPRIAYILRRRLEARSQEVFVHPLMHRAGVIVVPHTPEEYGLPIPREFADRVVFVGPIARHPSPDARAEVRMRLGVDPDAVLVTSTVGGGGFEDQADRFFEIVESIVSGLTHLDPRPRHVIVTGPNFRNEDRIRRLRTLTDSTVIAQESQMIDLLAASDLVIAEGGYNTVSEIRVCRVPALFIPGVRGLDDQAERVRRLEALGVAVVCDPTESNEAIAKTARSLFDGRLDEMRSRYSVDDFRLGNDDAARAIIGLAR